jgi:hypothetical protein
VQLGAITVCGVQAKENFAEGIGLIAELNKKGGQQGAEVLFSDILEIKVKICHRGQHGVRNTFDILDDRRAARYPIE